MKSLFAILLSVFSLCSFAQNIEEAARHHYLDEHFVYNPALIRKEKIKAIEKVVYSYEKDSITHQVTTERHTFKENGLPLRIESMKTWASDTAIVDFQYDSLNNLVRKTVWRYANSYPYKMREWQIFYWKYQEKKLIGSYSYNTVNDYPERLVQYASDSIAYDHAAGCVRLFSNYSWHTKNNAIRTNPDVSLVFYPNYKLETRIGHTYTEVREFDSCGYYNAKLPNLLAGLIGYNECFSPGLKWLNSRVDSIIKGDTLTIIHLEGLHKPGKDLSKTELTRSFKTQSWFFADLDNTSWVRIYTEKQQIVVQTVGEGMSIKQAGNEHHHTREVKYYDYRMRLLKVERFTSDYWQGIDSYDMPQSERRHSPERLETEVYDYYDNGLLKSIVWESERLWQSSYKRVDLFRLSYF